MSDPRIIPIFPLSMVQFPGAITPLHIFEDRYRKMLRDVIMEDKSFGITLVTEEDYPGIPPVGRVGCAVKVLEQQMIPDGRSNILCKGLRRYQTLRHIEDELYLQAEVEFFDDETELEDLTAESEELSGLFLRVLKAERKLRHSAAPEDTTPIDFPDDKEELTFMIAGGLDLENQEKQSLLETTSTAERLRRLMGMMKKVTEDYERRAIVHEVSKKNGHGGKIKL